MVALRPYTPLGGKCGIFMAAVWTVDASIFDRKKGESHVIVYLPATATVAQVTTFVESWVEYLEALISGEIRRVSATLNINLNGLGLRTAALDGADREEGGKLTFLTDGAHYTNQRIPTILEEFITEGTKVIDTAATEVSTYVTYMLTGVTGAVPCDSRGEDLVDVSSAVDDFKRYKRTYAAS